jgi:uncharacterized protein
MVRIISGMMNLMSGCLLWTRRAAFLLALVIGVGITAAATQESPGGAAALPQGPAMWKVETPTSTMYLFGTFHLLMPGMEWQSTRILDAFDASDTVTFEMNEEQSDPGVVAWVVSQRGTYRGLDSLDRHLDDEVWAALTRHAAETGIPLSTLAGFKPWYAATAITIQGAMMMGFRPDLGVESILEDRAKERGVPVYGLELAVDQIEALADLPLETQVELLERSLDEFSSLEEKFGDLAAAWLAGDEAALTVVLVDDVKEYDDVYQALYVQRNREWVPMLAARLERPGVHFVAIGTAHLVGDQSVIAGLRARGFTVERY